MTAGNRKIWARPYAFELISIANFLLIFGLVARRNLMVLASVPATFAVFLPTLAGYTAVGVIIRAAVAWRRGELRRFLRVIGSAGWLTDTVRLLIFGAVMAHTYFWIKLLVPLMHPRLFDQQMWDIDQAMFFGFSPNILFLNLFSNPILLRVIDWGYARIFFVSMTVAFTYFMSAPSRRLRIGFSTGNTLLWLIGAWLYMLLPSLGPAFRFPDVWLPYAASFPITQQFQAILMKNYQAVLRLPRGGSFADVQLMFGVAAFPSLHVAFQTFAYFWMRRLWIYGEIVFGIFTVIILVGSVVTGWHYLIDGIAAVIMAAVSYDMAVRMWKIRRWRRLWLASGRRLA